MRSGCCLLILMSLVGRLSAAECGTTREMSNAAADGYNVIWYASPGSYSGGFAMFPSQHSPLAVYCTEVKKTFFVYGGTVAGKRQLQAMASYYDHQRGVVPRPSIVHDWGEWNLNPGQIADGHRNPTVSIDDGGHVWVFVSGHGDAGYIYRSKDSYSVERFERIIATTMTYPNPWWIANKGFLFSSPGDRVVEQLRLRVAVHRRRRNVADHRPHGAGPATVEDGRGNRHVDQQRPRRDVEERQAAHQRKPV